MSIGGASSTARRNGDGEQGPKYYKQEGSGRRGVGLIVAGVVIAAILVVLLISTLKGGGSHPSATSASSSEARSRGASGGSGEGATNPGAMSVVVLNGTSTEGLAHHLASDLQQSGYSDAAASGAVPSGTHPSTVVEYSSGHRADARRVAKALAVTTQVQPIEGSIASLTGSAQVVVIAGADQAAQLGGGGVQSQGEPAITGAGGATGAVEPTPAA